MAERGAPKKNTRYYVDLTHDPDPSLEYVTVTEHRPGSSGVIRKVFYGEDAKKLIKHISQ